VTIVNNLSKTLTKITSYEITKRQKFILMSVFLMIALVTTQTVSENIRYQVMIFMVAATAFLAIFALWGELSGIKYFLLLLLPIYFVAGASLFYFLLPVRWLTRVPYALMFGISVYLLMLTSNIYNVAAIRTIALLRAARAVGLLFSLIATFFLGNVLFSLHLPFYLVVAGVAVIVAPLYLVGLWSYELLDWLSKRVLLYCLIFTLVTSEAGLVLSFWPIVSINGALVLATIMYVLLGLAQFNFENRLKPRIIWEHLSIATIVFVIVLVSTRWGG
jgi:hypothetical protein